MPLKWLKGVEEGWKYFISPVTICYIARYRWNETSGMRWGEDKYRRWNETINFVATDITNVSFHLYLTWNEMFTEWTYRKADWVLDFLNYILDIFKNLLDIASPVAGLSRVGPAAERSKSCHFFNLIYTFSHPAPSWTLFTDRINVGQLWVGNK